VSRRPKRQRSASPPAGSSPTPLGNTEAHDDRLSLPPSSPPAPFSDTDESIDDRDAIPDIDAEEEGEGEDLFADNMDE
jgi:DNA replication licensing factor MCM2